MAYDKEKVRAYYEQNKEKIKAASLKYYEEHKEEVRVKRLAYYHAHKKAYREYFDEHKEEMKEKAKVWRVKYKEKIKAYHRERAEKCGYPTRAVTRALKLGEISKRPCEVCGKTEVEAHHCDYNKPLDVMWLCHEHHKEWHKHNTPVYKN